MTRENCDVLVLGAGFAGSITAMLLQRIGRSVVLVDRDAHPRFAIGESSTPLADLTLRRLAKKYNLPQLLPLTRYGDWKRTCPHITCGLKRGFSYFGHQPGRRFTTDETHSRELLVAASSNDDASDTHWLRSDVDALLVAEAIRESVAYYDHLELRPISREPWLWRGMRDGEIVEVEANFVLDATGPDSSVAKAVGARRLANGFQTQSRAIFGHFVGMTPWGQALNELDIRRDDYPFPCDAAAIHHLIEEGWMWQLPFDNGTTSAGLLLTDEGKSSAPAAEWSRVLGRYPSLQRQFSQARVAAPTGGLQSTGRLQRRWLPAAGTDWGLLPATAGFIDPLHSTGIAHTMFGIERLIEILSSRWEQPEALTAALSAYDARLQTELTLIDRLVAACYATRRRFSAFAAATMLYFTAVTTCERRLLAGRQPAFLAADDEKLRSTLQGVSDRLIKFGADAAETESTLHSEVRSAIEPWNQVGLLSPEAANMYQRTAPTLSPY